MSITCAEQPAIGLTEIRTPAVTFARRLPATARLIGTPTVTELGSSDLTISVPQINTTEVTIGGVASPPGTAVQWQMSGQGARRYRLRVTCPTDGSPTETLAAVCVFVGQADS